jgi:hypothetical protein
MMDRLDIPTGGYYSLLLKGWWGKVRESFE